MKKFIYFCVLMLLAVVFKSNVYAVDSHAVQHEKGGSDPIATVGDLTVDSLNLTNANSQIWTSGGNLWLKDSMSPAGTYALSSLAMWGGIRNAEDFSSGSSTAGIQEAIDSLPAEGGVVYIPKGTHQITSTICITKANVSIIGAGRDATSIWGSVSPALIWWNGKNFVTIRDLSLNGINGIYNGIQHPSGEPNVSIHAFLENLRVFNCNNGILLSHVNESVIRNLRVDYCTNGINFDDSCSSLYCSEILSASNSGWALRVSAASDVSRCEALQFSKCNFASSAGNLVIYNGMEINFNQCMFTEATVAEHVDIQGGAIIRFSQCWFDSPAAYSRVRVSPLNTNLSKVYFTDCSFRCRGAGLHVLKDSGSGRFPTEIFLRGCDFDMGSELTNEDIFLSGANRVNVLDCLFNGSSATYSLRVDSECTDIRVTENIFQQPASKVSVASGTTKFRNNYNFVTDNSGTGTIASGYTSVTVSHGLNVTPDARDIQVIFTNEGTNAYGRFWINNITATQFTFNVASNPGSSGLNFAWQAEVLRAP